MSVIEGLTAIRQCNRPDINKITRDTVYVPTDNVGEWLLSTHKTNLILIEASTIFKDTIVRCYECRFVKMTADEKWYLIAPKYGFWANTLVDAELDYHVLSGPDDTLDEAIVMAYLRYQFVKCEYALQ